MNISRSHFSLFNLKFFGEIVTPLFKPKVRYSGVLFYKRTNVSAKIFKIWTRVRSYAYDILPSADLHKS